MPSAISSLFIFGLVLILGPFVASMMGRILRLPWVRQTQNMLALWIVVILGFIAVFWASMLKQQDHSMFEGITGVLAIVAIGFAMWQFRDSQELRARMQAFDKEMRSVADQMTTKFAGFFPKNLSEIVQVIRKAEKRVDVMSDFAGYGHYSSPRQFDKYFRSLLDLPSKNIQVRMLIYTRKAAKRMHENQFVDSDFKEPQNWSKLKTFCNSYESNLSSSLCAEIRKCDDRINALGKKIKDGLQPTEQELSELDADIRSLRPEFDRLMFDRQQMYIKDLLQHGAEIRQTGEKLPFFLWCEDGSEAVFTFLHEKAKADREVSFRTRDGRLVADSFEKKFEYLWNQKATKVELKDFDGHVEPNWLHETATSVGASVMPLKAA